MFTILILITWSICINSYHFSNNVTQEECLQTGNKSKSPCKFYKVMIHSFICLPQPIHNFIFTIYILFSSSLALSNNLIPINLQPCMFTMGWLKDGHLCSDMIKNNILTLEREKVVYDLKSLKYWYIFLGADKSTSSPAYKHDLGIPIQCVYSSADSCFTVSVFTIYILNTLYVLKHKQLA